MALPRGLTLGADGRPPSFHHSADARLASALMNGHVEGIVRESGLSPDLIHTISKDLADGIFLKLLKKDFKDGSYYRTIIARMTAAQSTKAIAAASHKAIAAKVRTSARAELLFSYTLHSCAHPSCIRQGKQKQGKQSKQGKQGSPDACICMARVRGLELELTCLVTPTPDEEFQLGLISQNMAFRVRETSIRLACTNLEQIMRRVAGLTFKSGGVAEGKPPGMSLVQLEEGSDVEIVGLVGAAKHNGRRGTVGSYDAEKQRYAVSLPACRSPAAAAAATAAGGDGKRMAAQKIAVKASNLLPLTMPVPSSGGEDAGEITATLWSIESKGSLSMVSLSPLSALRSQSPTQPQPQPQPQLAAQCTGQIVIRLILLPAADRHSHAVCRPGCLPVCVSAHTPTQAGPEPRIWEPEGSLPACLAEGGVDLISKMECVEFSARPQTLVGEAADGTRVQMQLPVGGGGGEGRGVGGDEGAGLRGRSVAAPLPPTHSRTHALTHSRTLAQQQPHGGFLSDLLMNVWMNVCMDGWMDGWVAGWMMTEPRECRQDGTRLWTWMNSMRLGCACN
jgi:hypothetical protein